MKDNTKPETIILEIEDIADDILETAELVNMIEHAIDYLPGIVVETNDTIH